MVDDAVKKIRRPVSMSSISVSSTVYLSKCTKDQETRWGHYEKLITSIYH